MSHLHLWPVKMPVYLHRFPVDFRKQINGLAVLVSESMRLDPFKPSLYVFCNGARNRIKVLYWDGQGFCLWLKRLEKGRFVWALGKRFASSLPWMGNGKRQVSVSHLWIDTGQTPADFIFFRKRGLFLLPNDH